MSICHLVYGYERGISKKIETSSLLQYFTAAVVRQAKREKWFKEDMHVICQYVPKRELSKVSRHFVDREELRAGSSAIG